MKVNKKTGEETEIDEHPPTWCVEAIFHRGDSPEFRRLNGIATSPTIRPDGSILSEPGYDTQTGLLLVSSGESLDIPHSPTIHDVKEAVETLLDVVADFPFASPSHVSAWLALTLTPFARHAFAGPSPLFLIDANTRGTGKSLLADVASRIVTGRPAARMSSPSNDDETRKRITSIALRGDPLVLIDNIVGEFGSASLDAALTSVMWSDRILGKTEITTLPLLTTWVGTGNNVILAADTTRRVCHIRLLSPEENPEQRTGFRHEHLMQFVADHRSELVRSCLMILRGYFAAGCPAMNLPEWGSYEGWSKIVRNAIVWAGQEDPGATREELAKRSDVTAGGIRDLLHSWNTIDPNGDGLTSGGILEILSRDFNRFEEVRTAISELCGSPPGKLPSPRVLGNRLRGIRERIVDGKYLDAREDRTRRQIWLVRDAESAVSAESISCQAPNENITGQANFPHAKGLKKDSSDPADSADVTAQSVDTSERETRQTQQEVDWDSAAQFPDIE